MTMTGGCLCGELRFEVTGDVRMRGLCLCHTCQKLSGGAGNLFIGVEDSSFRYLQGEPQRFASPLKAQAPTRDFCGSCGVHIAARSPKAPGGVIVKVGALDDPSVFKGPDMVFWVCEKRDFHSLPEGAAAFASLPGR